MSLSYDPNVFSRRMKWKSKQQKLLLESEIKAGDSQLNARQYSNAIKIR